MDLSRRRVLLSTLFGSGYIGLRALATGLPMGFLLNPRKARATTLSGNCTAAPQSLILATSSGGNPVNANVPGMYGIPDIYHSTDAAMLPTQLSIGGKSYMAAKPWADLGPNILSRTCFFHNATYTNSHGDLGKVNSLMGAVRRSEMGFSMYAKYLSQTECLGTVQPTPVVISNNFVTFSGGVVPVIAPSGLKQVLANPTGVLMQLQTIRDNDLNSLNTLLKAHGTTAQRQVLDEYATSQTQVRNIAQNLLNDLSTIKGDSLPGGTPDPIDQNIAASVLVKMKVSPVVVIMYDFGSDNHGDQGLALETTGHVRSCGAITDLMNRLTTYQIADTTTFAIQEVFGRTLVTSSHKDNADGRNHHDKHHCTVMIGSAIKGSVIGGVVSMGAGKDYRAQGINSADGTPNDSGDVPYEALLASTGKTLGSALGVPSDVLDFEITSGKVVPAALK